MLKSFNLKHAILMNDTFIEFPHFAAILVSTGVFNPDKKKQKKVFHGHRDFECKQELLTPTIYSENCYTAIQTILQMERFDPATVEV